MSVDDDLDTPERDDAGPDKTQDDSLGTRAEVETIGPCKLRLKAEVPAEKVNELLDRNYRDLISTLQLPGFRRGRVPRALVEKRYGEEVEKDLKEALLNDSFLEVVEEKELKVIGAPKFSEVRFEKNSPFCYDVELEVRPDFDLEGYKGVEVAVEPLEITDEDIEAEIEALRARQASLAPVAVADAGPDDIFYGSYRLSVAGEEVFSTPETVPFRPADGYIGSLEVPELAEKLAAIENLSEGATLNATVEIPADFPFVPEAGGEDRGGEGEGEDPDGEEADAGAGEAEAAASGERREAELELRIEDAKRRQLPDLDDDFARSLQAESVDELRKRVKETLETRNRVRQERQIEDRILEKIEESVEFELPQGILESQKKAHKMRLQYELADQGKTKEEIEEELQKVDEEADDSGVRKQLKSYFILEKIAEDEKIFATENDLQSRVAMLAQVYGRRPEEIADELERTNSFEEMRVDIRHGKVREFLRRKAKILNGGDAGEPKDSGKPQGSAEDPGVENSAENRVENSAEKKASEKESVPSGESSPTEE